jgi:beta-glucosidase-like glycosyl hydrolase
MGIGHAGRENTQYPYAITLGALPESESNLVYELGRQIGLDLKSAGITI